MPTNFEPKLLKPKLDIVEKPLKSSAGTVYASITVNVYECGKSFTVYKHTHGDVIRIREYIRPWNWGFTQLVVLLDYKYRNEKPRIDQVIDQN